MTVVLRNRISGLEAVDPGEVPLVGMWTVSAMEGGPVFLNAIPVQTGEFVVPDAGGQWSLLDDGGRARREGTFGRKQILDEFEVESVTAIGERLGELTNRGEGWLEWLDVSPMVPAMSQHLEILGLERSIRAHLGHLEEVCHRPRSHLNVDIERVTVSRARRIPKQAAAFLASHTEDWGRPTLRTVIPKRILSVIREEQYDIYENRVAARLVDHLIAYLGKRINHVRRLLALCREAADYASDAAEGSHWRQKRVYRLWGDSVDANEGRRRAERTLRELEALKLRVGSLLGSVLYQEVPRRAWIGSTLTMTDVLVNDAHYRHVAELWREWALLGLEKLLSPLQIFRAQQVLCRSFTSFCALLLLRALDQMKYEPRDLGVQLGRGTTVEVQGPDGVFALNWLADDTLLISDKDGVVLRFVPVPASLAVLGEERVRKALVESVSGEGVGSTTVVLYPAPSGADAVSLWKTSSSRWLSAVGHELPLEERLGVGLLPVSPWDLGSVERVARALRWALGGRRTTLVEYPPAVSAPPPGVFALERASAWLQSEGESRVMMIRPPLEAEIAALRVDECVQNAEKEVKELERKREKVSNELRDATRRGDATGSLNAEKRTLHADCVESRDALERAHAFVSWLKASTAQLSTLLRCPICGKEADSRRDFRGGPGKMFRCTCPGCGGTWGRRWCGQCGSAFPTLLPGGVSLACVDCAGRADWIDRFLGADVLAAPSSGSKYGTEFVCPTCGRAG